MNGEGRHDGHGCWDPEDRCAKGNPGELGDVGHEVDNGHAGYGDARPGDPIAHPNELGMPTSGNERQPGGHLLHQVQDRDQGEQREQQGVAGLGSGLAGSYHAWRVDVGQHHNPGRAHDAKPAGQRRTS